MRQKKNKKILILEGHPDPMSFGTAMADQYYKGALSKGFEVDRLAVRDLKFDPILHYGYRRIQQLEPDLLEAQKKIAWCDHLALLTPVWWGKVPGLLKGFFDRILLSGFSHQFDLKKNRPVPLLRGRTASVLYTQGAPKIYSLLVTKDAFWKALKKCVLEFCGFRPVKRKYFDTVKSGTDRQRQEVLQHAYFLGTEGY